MEDFLNNNRKYYTNVQQITEPDRLTVLVDKFNQLDSDYIPTDLEKIIPCFNPEGLLLRHEARRAFEDMCLSAAWNGMHLEAVSAFRSYSYQSQIYMKNWSQEMNLEEYQMVRDRVSARPGHSEHQTGLAVDINDLEQTFEKTSEAIWLADHSYLFGFILRYPKGKENITGYDYEPWHFRYIGRDIAESVYCSGLTYDEYFRRYYSW